MSCVQKEMFGGRVEGSGKVEGEISKPVNLVLGKVRATSMSHAPVPLPMSAILRGPRWRERLMLMVGWIRKPRVWVVMWCCSSSLVEEFGVRFSYWGRRRKNTFQVFPRCGGGLLDWDLVSLS